VLDRENVGPSKPVHKPAIGFYRPRSFRELEILVERVRFATVLLGGLAGALFIWVLPDSIPPDTAVKTLSEPCMPFPAKQARLHDHESNALRSAARPCSICSRRIAP
jgi:hypothetical protein